MTRDGWITVGLVSLAAAVVVAARVQRWWREHRRDRWLRGVYEDAAVEASRERALRRTRR